MKKIVSLGLVIAGLLVSQVAVAHAQPKFFVQDGVGVGDVAVEATVGMATTVLGQPADSESESDGSMYYTWYTHPGEINAIVRDGRIEMLFADGPMFRTQSGIPVRQSTMTDVRIRLGEPAEMNTSHGLVTWFFWTRGINVTFRDGVVEYVSVFSPE